MNNIATNIIVIGITLISLLFSANGNANPKTDNYTLTNPDSSAINNAVSFYHQKKLPQAQQAFEKILKSDEQALDALVYLTRIYAQQKKFDDAEDAIEQALKLAPKNAFVQNLSGKIYSMQAMNSSIFSALGYAKKGLKGFKTAVELAPDNVEYRQALISYYIGAPSIAGGDEDLALKHAQSLYKIDKKQGYIAIAEALNKQEDKKALAAHFANTPSNLQNDAEVLLTKGFIYQQQKDHPKALNYFQQAVENSKSSDETSQQIKFQALYQLGKTSDISENQLDLGISSLEQYIAHAPELNQLPSKEWAQFRLANLFKHQGNSNKAKSLYQLVAKNTDDKNLKKKAKKQLKS